MNTILVENEHITITEKLPLADCRYCYIIICTIYSRYIAGIYDMVVHTAQQLQWWNFGHFSRKWTYYDYRKAALGWLWMVLQMTGLYLDFMLLYNNLYYILSIYRGYIWYDSTHSTTITVIKLWSDLHWRKTPIPGTYGRAWWCLSGVIHRTITAMYRERTILYNFIRDFLVRACCLLGMASK